MGLGEMAAILVLLMIAIVLYWLNAAAYKQFVAPLTQREPLKGEGKRKFKVVFYQKWVRPARFLRRSREVDRVVVTIYIWAVDESEAVRQAGQGRYKNLSRVEVIDWSY